jgi:hypothetical protein
MNIQKQVFGKLFQEENLELESQKYEFAGRDISQVDADVEKILTNFTKARFIAQEKMIDYKLTYKTYEKQIQGLKSDAIQLEGDLENIASALASMGVPSNGVEGFQKAKQKVNILMKAIEDGESSLVKFKNPIN